MRPPACMGAQCYISSVLDFLTQHKMLKNITSDTACS